MLVNSVIIVLREVLEAALMISVLLAVSQPLRISARWLRTGLFAGLVGAVTYGLFINPISELFEGVGQEVLNALLQFGVFAVLALVAFLIARQRAEPCENASLLPTVMALAIALAVTREGSEIMVFVSGFLQVSGFLSSVGLGSFAGAAIGCSVGVLFYYFLLSLSERRTLQISLVLLTLAASGMAAQATGLLIQADWINISGALWDTSSIVAEDSLPGQLLYALIGYEATPSAIEVMMYAASIAVMAVAVFAGFMVSRSKMDDSQ